MPPYKDLTGIEGASWTMKTYGSFEELMRTDNWGDTTIGFNIKYFPWLFEKVIFNEPATIVLWSDKTKTVVKACADDFYDPMVGLAMCICKKVLGDQYKRIFRKYEKQYNDQIEEGLENFDNTLDILDLVSSIRKGWEEFEERIRKENGKDNTL